MTGRLHVYRFGLWMTCLLAIAGGFVMTARAADTPPTSGLVEQVPRDQAVAVLGKSVSTPDGKAVGRLVDVLVNAEGMPEAGVIDFGGFMGVGARKIAVHWATLHFAPANAKQSITLDLTPDQIKAVPEYRDTGKPAPVVLPTTTEPAATASASTERATTEPATPDLAITEPAKPEPAASGQATTGQAVHEPANPESATTGQAMHEPANPESATTGPATTGQALREPATAGQAPTGPATPGQAPREPATIGQALREPAPTGQAPIGPPTPGQAPREPATTGQAPTGPATTGPATPGPAPTGPATTERSTTQPETGPSTDKSPPGSP